MGPGDARVGLEEIDLVLAKKITHALGELVGGLAAALDDAREIDLHFADLDAVFLGGAAD